MNMELSLHIHSQHADWLVVEKEPHLLIHPTRPEGPTTLWHRLIERYPNEKLALIHRLDRETSGLVLAARSSEAAGELGRMMMRRDIEKEYIALVLGLTPLKGEVNQPIDRLGNHAPSAIYIKRGIAATGQPALTLFERIDARRHASGGMISILRVRTLTGRLHQIRVHLSSIGHAVIGDKIYGPDETCYLRFIEEGWNSALEHILWLPRHALHACRLTFNWRGEPLRFESPLPPDLQAFWDKLEPVCLPAHLPEK